MVAHRTLWEHVADEIKRMIVEQELSPGTKIDQASLARMLDVSRIPVRQALSHLAERGFVLARPHYSAVVAPLSRTDAQHLYELRGRTEQWAMREALTRVTRDDLDYLRKLIDSMAQLAGRGDSAEYLKVNRDFHLSIYALAENPYLVRTLTGLYDLGERYHRAYLYTPGMTAESLQDHREMVDLIEQRDLDALLKIADRHSQRTLDRVFQNLDAHEASESRAVTP